MRLIAGETRQNNAQPPPTSYNSTMKEFESIAKLLGELPHQNEVPAAQHEQDHITEFWCKQLGAVGKHSSPLLFISRRLAVFATSASWGNEIRHQSNTLIESLAQFGIRVDKIDVHILPDSGVRPFTSAHRVGKD